MVEKKLNVAIFSGGRGTANIGAALMDHGEIDLKILVNAYDDGLSTGALRRFIPGMLGPSDIRKNISRFMDLTDTCQRSLQAIIEYRLPDKFLEDSALPLMELIIDVNYDAINLPLREHFQNLSFAQIQKVTKYFKVFLAYYREKKQQLDFSDYSVGNILFAGCYLENNQDFNAAIEDFSKFSKCKAHIVNITQGENLVLVGIKEDGTYLRDEAEIVSKQNDSPLKDIYLLDRYLSNKEHSQVDAMNLNEKCEFLASKEVFPKLSSEAEKAIAQADMIIYGPGTQHSSLFPSYITENTGKAIANNKTAEKIFISNIFKDHEIEAEDANSLVEKLLYYLNQKNKQKLSWDELVTTFFFQREGTVRDVDISSYVPFNKENFSFPLKNVVLTDWQSKSINQPGIHSGGQILDSIIDIANNRLQKKLSQKRHLVSIIVPALNEEKTVGKVLQELTQIDFHSLGLGKEIIFVDGGSIDKTFEIASSFQNVNSFKLNEGFGRGHAYREGISRASGDIIIFFPSDDEYKVQDIYKVIQCIAEGNYKVVFGSRMIKCVNLTERIKSIYQDNYFGYLVSKFGGIALSVLCLVLYNRFVTDFLTSIKAFDAKTLKSLNLKSNGVDLDSEIIARLSKTENYFLELPVDFVARTKSQGKKTSVFDGIKSLWILIKIRWSL